VAIPPSQHSPEGDSTWVGQTLTVQRIWRPGHNNGFEVKVQLQPTVRQINRAPKKIAPAADPAAPNQHG
jgi:hypothetical protein